MQYTINKTLKI